eukprot:CAMPEP_0178433084 /NCGR_PEP_ID=MMETSP0689_2-20121128/32722_1 /TAXON_ID=160604 /ORGANISM="Amphidinium massartii, Strain CS-259" /LENGTH=41 /DNA_ID= /DNA_START= /DNA_END= /DNA_ORIENTATION=
MMPTTSMYMPYETKVGTHKVTKPVTVTKAATTTKKKKGSCP